MPSQDRVRLHNDQGRAPIAPRLGEQHPKQSVALAELRTLDGSSQDRQLLTEGHVLKRDGAVSVTDQPERSEQYDKRGQHASSCRAIDQRINRRGWRSGFGEAHQELEFRGTLRRRLAIRHTRKALQQRT